MSQSQPASPAKRRYVPAVGPRLRLLLHLCLWSFALLAINGVYLVAVTIAEWSSGATIQNYFYQSMFLAHLALGLAIAAPVIAFGVLHIRNAHNRPNRLAVRAGYALFVAALLVIGSGLVLTRLEGLIEVKDPGVRAAAYWTHVLAPLVVIWLFILHRLAGPRIRWRAGGVILGVAAALAVAMVLLHSQDPRRWNVAGPASGERYFLPSLARTATGNFIPPRTLMMDDYCAKCHADVHKDWSHSAHRFSSFNNPAYLFAVRETRKVVLERDGNVQASRFCAGCHDPVPFFGGAFDDPAFDDVGHFTAKAGVTCTVCHAITNVNSVRGNSDYTIEEPTHYPFAFSDNPFLQWVNEQLVKAKPDFHKRTFLKPLHRTAEFCGACHKVHLPEALNGYKWLRGQNHYDSFRRSGVSGHGAASFYYPERAERNCTGCHMPLRVSDDFGAKFLDDTGRLKVHDHQFPSANTGIPHLLGLPDEVNAKHRAFNEGVVRVDLFGVKEGGTIDGALVAPLRPTVPTLVPGTAYLFETVVRTLKMGHEFTQGTADSNEVWLDVTVRSGDRVIGRSGGRRADGEVDPWSHFVNAYVLDRNGERIDRRNAQDIFVPLYDHQIPPGAADVVHYKLLVPADAGPTLTVEVALQYRKFDTRYMKHVHGADFVNDLPIITFARDAVTFPVATTASPIDAGESKIPTWQRWNDYGIGLLRKGETGANRGELRQAEAAFQAVEQLGRADGPLNLARSYLKEGRLEEAVAALARAGTHEPPAPPWSLEWFAGLVDRQNGHLDRAIERFTRVAETRFVDAPTRGFDFSRDDRVLATLAQTLFERALQERAGVDRRDALLREALRWYRAALDLDPESVAVHYGLAQVYQRLGDDATAAEHRALHARYRVDDNARDRVIASHRAANPAADHAAEAIVIYDLQRTAAYDR
ncbi:MAG: tetratricopeptide repeat protein [Planctomycetes bacterium]|nr:tetratricopeptide repeat protein [Planctomycetota bacterium]